ncbi:hypothetical protein DICSQDRAFT_156307 [Dichomitus squalens LYAD-421 SS1]|uniref:Tail specific protease domain-containing protein n=1 Tax=Dichomitus squalens (strain LYAD-421) TaxID=732165 RepID=R7STB5_DICSQ|nr:uncharacterized protein DICSQDRAFT_156307 [Dichomitus squalens LYAD-421 SS1]EJF59301.1 hypothetical protein DICSQDRAFT_156307 [Dichomitus squalens LYAD-421 SS1]
MIAGRFLTLLPAVLASVRLGSADVTSGLPRDVTSGLPRDVEERAADPCATIGGKTWAAPADVRACYQSFPVNETEKANIIEVVNKTLAFHTSVNYEKLAPPPFTLDVHEDLLRDLARIQHQKYASDYDLHIDLSRTLKRLDDGHCVYINYCYDSLFVNYLPTPLVLLTDDAGHQSVHIAPEAFTVATAEFADEVQTWQDALPGALKGQLASLSGAKVLAINGQDPWIAVDANAAIAGSFQGLGTRQNGYFASYNAGAGGWTYSLGQFAQQSLPLSDSVRLTIQRVNSTKIETVSLPYRSRFGTTGTNFTDSASYRANNCVAGDSTNGVDYYAEPSSTTPVRREDAPSTAAVNPANKFRQAPMPDTATQRRYPMNVMLDSAPQLDIALPPTLVPTDPQPGSASVVQFYLLDDGKTGVLALGSFSGDSFENLETNLLTGLQGLKAKGATQLIVDVSNNGGGYICIAHWLHRIIAGPKSTTVPQAGLDTQTRDGPLAQLIVKAIAADPSLDPDEFLLYNPVAWTFANNTKMPAGYDWLQPPVKKTVNGVADAFSQRLGQECQPFDVDAPAEALFDTRKVVIVGNGRCASSCSLFSITLAKEEGAKTVVYGGKRDVPQQYCGTVGGQSTDFSTIDSEVKTTHLKNNSLAPPDFLTNSVQGITWRLGFGIDNKNEPEEWQNHPADVNLALTADIVSNPAAIWKKVAETVL